MIKAIIVSEDKTKKMLLIGLSRMNWEMLMKKHPIAFSVTDLQVGALSDIHTICIVGGEDEQAITTELAAHFTIVKPQGAS